MSGEQDTSDVVDFIDRNDSSSSSSNIAISYCTCGIARQTRKK